jgi:hypothetical protein
LSLAPSNALTLPRRYSLRCYYDGLPCQPVTVYITDFPLNYSNYAVHLEFEDDLCEWGNNMEVVFAPLNADWGFAHLVINSVCFAFSVLLTLYARQRARQQRFVTFQTQHFIALTPSALSRRNTACMYWMWCFHAPGEGLQRVFQRMLPEQKCITFALAALIFLNQPQSVFYRNSLYYFEGQMAELILYCFAIAAFLTYWLVIIDVMSKQNPQFSTFRKGFWIYKSLFFALFFAAHLLRLAHVLGYAREESGAQNSQSDPDFFEKLGGPYFVSCAHALLLPRAANAVFTGLFLIHGRRLVCLVGGQRAQVQPQSQDAALSVYSIPAGCA